MTLRLARLASLAQGGLLLLLLMAVLEQAAHAQTNDDKGGFAVRELSVSTGYVFVQLPPITLGGKLPEGVLNEDLITMGTATIDWQRVTARTRYRLDAFGMYTARTFYPRLSAPAADVRFGISRAFGSRWRLGDRCLGPAFELGSTGTISRHRRGAVGGPGSFEDLAGAAAVPQIAASGSGPGGALRPNQHVACGIRSSRRPHVCIERQGGRELRAFREARNLPPWRLHDRAAGFVEHRSSRDALVVRHRGRERVGVGVRYDSSERTQITVALDGSQTVRRYLENIVVRRDRWVRMDRTEVVHVGHRGCGPRAVPRRQLPIQRLRPAAGSPPIIFTRRSWLQVSNPDPARRVQPDPA